jgi:hypothetical protein
MRRNIAISCLSLAALAAVLSCSSKSSSPPTAPTPSSTCSLSATALSFGTVTAGSSAERSFTLANTGGGTLSGTVSVPAGPFSLVGSPTYSLSAGQSVIEAVRYTWQQAGAASATVSTGCGNVACSADGGPSPCGVNPTSLSFGTVRVGDSRDLSFSVNNSGSTAFIATAQETCADFSFVGSSSWYVNPGTTAEFTLRFTPTRGGSQTCSVALSNVCSKVVATGSGEVSNCYVSPLTLDFGTVTLDNYSTQTFLVRNDGSTRLTGSVDIPPGESICASFWFPDHDSTYDLAPGGSKSFLLALSPRLIAPFSCIIATGPAACAPIT